MKKLIVILVLFFWGFVGVSEITANPRVSGYFYNSLSPFGSWIEIDYGVVVWRPTIMKRNWSPYREGRWIWTSDGWYWQSYEPFGHITYHYGRWYFDDYYGWLWYPDYEWAPAWVEWRYDNDYIGWAPLHPYALFSIAIGIHYTTVYYIPYYHWNFVVYNNFYDPYVYNHCVAPRYKYRVYSNTRYRNNYTYRNGRVRNNGVDVKIVRTRSGQKIRERDLQRVSDTRSLHKERLDDKSNIKTFYRSRDELVNNELKDVKIERSERKSSLDVRKIRRGEIEKKNIERKTDKERTKQLQTKENERYSYTKKERTKTNEERKINNSNERKRIGNDVTRKKTGKENVNNKNLNRNLKKKNEKIDRQKKSTVNKNKEIRVKNNKQKKEVKVNRNKTKNVQTKTDIKKRVNKTFSEKNKKTTVKKRNTNNVKKTKVKTNRKSSDKKKNKRSRG
jgi:hypothetical protein